MKDEAMSESSLVLLAQAGDAQALNVLFSRHEGVVRDGIRRRLSPAVRRKVADSDVLQETLVVASRRIEDFEYRGVGSFQAWLAAIAGLATRKAVERYAGTQKRDVRTEIPRDARAQTGQLRGGMPSPSQVAMGAEAQQLVAEALFDMPEDYQAVIQLLQHRRVTLAEASELMDRSVNAVKKLHARALAELADRLGIEGREGS